MDSSSRKIEENLEAMNLGMFWLGIRKKRVDEWLSSEDWRKLNKLINDYAPHLLITISRRIPRFPYFLDLVFGSPTAGKPLIISDLAIPWSAESLKKLAEKSGPLRVAMVDDSFSSGVTHGYVRDQLLALLPTARIKCFVIALEKARPTVPENRATAFRPFNREDVIAVRELPFSREGGLPGGEETYPEFTRKAPRALTMLPKPYDIEYPVLTVAYKSIKLAAEAEARINRIFGGRNVHSLNTNFMEEAGLARYGIDLAPEGAVARKLRLYFDDARRECRLTAHAPGNLIFPGSGPAQVMKEFLSVFPPELEKFRVEAVTRLEIFISSLTLSLLSAQLFEDFLEFDAAAPPFSRHLAGHLFGPDTVEKYWRGRSLGSLRQEAENEAKKIDPRFDGSFEALKRFFIACEARAGQASPSPFWTIGLKEGKSELLREVRKKLDGTDVDVRFQNFKNFFYVLAERLGSRSRKGLTGRGLAVDGFPSARELADYAPLRHRVGPTFTDLMAIMKLLWNRGEALTSEQIHNEISYYLDCCIDDGVVVPAISPQGRRIYRKGESDTHNRDIARFYQLFRRPIEATRFFDLAEPESYRELSADEAALMKRSIKSADSQDYLVDT